VQGINPKTISSLAVMFAGVWMVILPIAIYINEKNKKK